MILIGPVFHFSVGCSSEISFCSSWSYNKIGWTSKEDRKSCRRLKTLLGSTEGCQAGKHAWLIIVSAANWKGMQLLPTEYTAKARNRSVLHDYRVHVILRALHLGGFHSTTSAVRELLLTLLEKNKLELQYLWALISHEGRKIKMFLK